MVVIINTVIDRSSVGVLIAVSVVVLVGVDIMVLLLVVVLSGSSDSS